MADLDEGAAVGPASTDNADTSLDDEVQDFRFLSSISSKQTSLPRRGEKDFEPHGTQAQSSTLDASRAAMHDALAQPRHHPPKGHVVGRLDLDTGCVVVASTKGGGTHFKNMGRGNRAGGVDLLPEEGLYLVERGTLDLRLDDGTGAVKDEDGHGDGDGELPLSLQTAYACVIGKSGLTLERFQVYTGLRRLGYIVQRAPSWYGDEESLESTATGEEDKQLGLWSWIASLVSEREQPLGPLVAPGLYRSYADIYRKLEIIPFHDPSIRAHTPQGKGSSGLSVCWHVWKPQSDFKKTAPGAPDFRIAVVDARESSVPELEDLDRLLMSTPFDPPRPDAQNYQKLKHGWRNVTLAVVDMGVVSYVRVSEAAFGKERLHERAAARGNKRGGGRGRGGRGRGRGRGR